MRVTAHEMNATGIRWDFGPVVAVPQDIRWGRTYEGYGEDTGLVSSARRRVHQGPPGFRPDARRHVGGNGEALHRRRWNGVRDLHGQRPDGPYLIDQGVDQMDEATLLRLFLPPYQAAIDNGTRIVMTSFSSTTAGKVHGDRHLITDVLKGRAGLHRVRRVRLGRRRPGGAG